MRNSNNNTNNVGPGSPSQTVGSSSSNASQQQQLGSSGRMNATSSSNGPASADHLQDPIERLMQSLQINNLSIPLVTQGGGNLVSTISATSYNSSFSSSFMTTLSSDSINNA